MPTTTTSLGGDRARRARSPRDITGREYQRQQAEQAARQHAKDNPADIAEIKRQARSDGYERGLQDGWDACIAALVAEGILAPDEPGDDGQDE